MRDNVKILVVRRSSAVFLKLLINNMSF